jgi:KDO2-lipid IV(A) lauroyltransferase
VILVTGHVGNWDLAGICIAAAGYPAHAVVEPAEPVLARTYDRYRAATGVRTLPLGTGLLSAYRVLTQREVLLLVGDRAIGDTGCEVRFGLGRRRSTQGPAELACRSKAPVLIGYVVLNPDPAGPRYLGRIQPLVSEPAGDPAELTRLINDRLATIVGEYPDQWFVFQPDWIPEDS